MKQNNNGDSAANIQNSLKQYTVTFLPFDISIDVPAGTSVLDAIKKAQLPIKATCGGKGTCGECLIRIISGSYRPRPGTKLSQQVISRGYSLACNTQINDHLTIELPQFQELTIQGTHNSVFFENRKHQLSGIYKLNPLVKSIDVQLPVPNLEENYSDLTRIKRALRKMSGIETVRCSYPVLQTLASTLRKNRWQVSIVLSKFGDSWLIIDIRSPKAQDRIYGIACDIGTTTVALQVIDLSNGKICYSVSSYNQQLKCGEDIISRINYARTPDRLTELQHLVVLTVNTLIRSTTEKLEISPQDIYLASIAGNTTMMHLLLHLDPRYIREEPYTPTFNQIDLISARDIGLNIHPDARVHLAPAVGSYLGGDITAGLLCTPVPGDDHQISAFIDIGTNGELVIGNREWLLGCACSAGPAFEGQGIQCGMPAAEGAIEQVSFEKSGSIRYKVIGNTKPKGLCGSGLIDLLAELFIHDYIDRYGKFNECKVNHKLVETDSGIGFLIEEAENCYWGKNLTIAEKDIANLIRTKAAIYSAISLMLKYIGINSSQINAFYIAGGFGKHLNIENAIRIGLFPDMPRENFHYLGNSSLVGACLMLMADENRKLVNDIAEKMTYIELNSEPGYMNEYTGALFLPHTEMGLFPTVKSIIKR
ncbi:DUF4445 domain-containing protein [candidate division KSB1 bacterium]|nr:DUF4445 domain-containing protein [candidate division KSB1 bacterium]